MTESDTDDMLTAVEMDVVEDLLKHGDNLPSNIAENTGRHKTSVSRRLAELEDNGFVVNKGNGVWALTDDGIILARTVIRNRDDAD